MATQVVMPKLSPTMEEGQLSRWLKKEGDKVTVGEPIAEVDTDKATMEAQALAEGVLRKILVKEGETVPLAATQAQSSAETAGNGRRAQGGRLLVSPIAARMAAEAGINLNNLDGSGPGGRIVKRDIEAALKSAEQRPQTAEPQAEERAAQA